MGPFSPPPWIRQSVRRKLGSGCNTRGVSRRSGLNADILAILHVSKAFFDAGTSVLWEKIDGLEPLFRLLPWYDVLCESAQVRAHSLL
ncbi:hypothetical protein FA13DRAFT_230520 [Coprinellus micaceus]|uniref:Uncharacterized protein n=1 Tax=Coprinellus micaceus TaxID=71717 RepID=A0A4Y7TFE3_COPMI|nr:hypothetical protein FA13DRAFT_230520 [Coprinellus micaceus]